MRLDMVMILGQRPLQVRYKKFFRVKRDGGELRGPASRNPSV